MDLGFLEHKSVIYFNMTCWHKKILTRVSELLYATRTMYENVQYSDQLFS